MDRRDFLRTTGAAAVAAGAASRASAANAECPAAPAIHTGARRLLLAPAWPAGLPGCDATRLGRRIEAATERRLHIEVAPPGADPDLSLAGASHPGHPAFAFFAGLPGAQGLDASLAYAWLAFGGGQMLWDELAAGFDFKPLVAGHTGASDGVWSSTRLDHTADLSGLTLHVSGLAGAVVRALGATPVELAPDGVRTALAHGRIAAVEWLGPLAAVAPDLAPLAERLYAPGVNRAGLMLSLNVRKALWDGLNAADQTILESCAAQEHQLSLAEGRIHALVARQIAATSKWPVRLAFAPEVAAALEQAAAGVVEDIAGIDAQSRRVHDSYQAFRHLVGEPPTG